jgi:phosphoglycolate phosphatase
VSRFGLIVFDLDGTLIDSRPDIADAVNEALADEGLPPWREAEIEPLIGDGARQLVERAIAGRLPPSATERVLGGYLEHYGRHPAGRTKLYPGVREGLAAITLRKAIATNKPAALTHAVVRALGLEALVDVVLGDGDVPRRKPAPDMLETAMARTGCTRASTLYVGDGRVDVLTARAAGVPLCLVSWGYGGGAAPEEAEYRVDRFAEIVALVRQD